MMKRKKLMILLFVVTIVILTSSFVFKNQIAASMGKQGVPLQNEVVGSTSTPTSTTAAIPTTATTAAPTTAPTATPITTPALAATPAPKPTLKPTPKPASRATPKPAPAPAAAPSQPQAKTDQQHMLDLINQERAKAGVGALKIDPQLQKMAQVKAEEMVAKSYFSHTSPTYGDPFNMMKTFGISFTSAGENIAGNSSVDNAHAALMNSPGHKANILNSSYKYIGIGITSSPIYGKMFAQDFVGR